MALSTTQRAVLDVLAEIPDARLILLYSDGCPRLAWLEAPGKPRGSLQRVRPATVDGLATLRAVRETLEARPYPGARTYRLSDEGARLRARPRREATDARVPV